ncbi:MAG: hypothetical protein LBF61_00840 [Azoarcus sp.]|jgi:hypothetical protein|nr:hypothetical protein [Azoarcus sp.]
MRVIDLDFRHVGPQGRRGPPGPPGSSENEFVQRPAGETLSALRAVWEDNAGHVWPLDYRDAAHVTLFAGITLTAAAAGVETTLQLSGVVDADGLGLGVGPVWIGEAGRLTQTPPTTGYLFRLGSAVSNNRLILSSSQPVKRE